jgi:hypothetical protein
MWHYFSDRGWIDKDGILVSKDCYSGNGLGFNNPAMETVVDVGPIPSGLWKIERPPYTDPKLGPYVLKLSPATPEFRARIIAMGRNPDTFRCHGKPLPPKDINSGSDGCICADAVCRTRIYQSGDIDLAVVSGIDKEES